MIEVKGLTARSARVALAPTTFSLGAGVHAFLGAAIDGVPLLLATLAGRMRPRAGAVLLLSQPPPAVLAQIAYVPLDTVLPDALTVEEALATAALIRGEPARPAEERLGTLGVAPLARRRVSSLTRGEVRAVAMAEALTSQAKIVLVDEPYAALDPRCTGELGPVLRERGAAGACVILGTASVRDAADLADDQLVFDRGVLVRSFGVDSATLPKAAAAAGASPPARLSLRVSDTAAVLARLAAESAVTSIFTERSQIVVSGADATELAAAVGRAVLAAGADVIFLRAEAPPLAALRG